MSKADDDPYGLNPMFTQSSSVRLTAFGSLAQTPAPDGNRIPAFNPQDVASRPSHFGRLSPRLSQLQSMGSAGSDQPLNETPGYIPMSSYSPAAIDAPPSPTNSNDSAIRQALTLYRKLLWMEAHKKGHLQAVCAGLNGSAMQCMSGASFENHLAV